MANTTTQHHSEISATALKATTTAPQISPRRFKIYFQDDDVYRRSQQTVQQLLTSAMNESASTTGTSSNSALLAKKALKYRKVFDRMAGVDVNAPEFDASKFLGVDWCKTTCLKKHCERQRVA